MSNDDWHKYQAQMQPGMPVIGYCVESPLGDCLRQNLQWQVCNADANKRALAFDLARLAKQATRQMNSHTQLKPKGNDALRAIAQDIL